MNTSSSNKVRALLRQTYSKGASTKHAREHLLSALQKVSKQRSRLGTPIEIAVNEFSKSDDFPWVISTVYWSLRAQGNSLPPGTVFTPPELANRVVNRLLPDLTVVDLGAGTGMLTITAARRGFKVIAIEEDAEMIDVLDRVARILRVRDLIDLRMQDALDYQGSSKLQIMSNPPYTRHQAIPPRRKKNLADLAGRLGVRLPLTAGHHAYFMIYAWTAEWSQKEVLLLPTNWIDAKYGTALRDIMIKRGPREILLLQNGDGKSVFNNALTTACLIATQQSETPAKKPLTKPRIKVVNIHGDGQNIKKNNLLPLTKFKKIFNFDSHLDLNASHTLGEIFRVKRGVATGSNSFFVLSRTSVHKNRIQQDELRPILRRLTPRMLQIDVEYLWVPSKSPSKISLSRIKRGKNLSIDKRYLCFMRKPWWRIEIPNAPDYFITYMGRRQPIIKKNTRNLLNLNNIHGLHLRKGVPKKVVERLIAWLRSSGGLRALMVCARHYQGGLWKLEPGDLERLNIPKEVL
jgi:hypothetical protein